jgi:hypothetical protein
MSDDAWARGNGFSIAVVNGPGFWMNEQSGVLAPVVKAYLKGDPLSLADVGTMRAYLRQWINAPVWHGEPIEGLRRQIDTIFSREDIDAWLEGALDEGIDPL